MLGKVAVVSLVLMAACSTMTKNSVVHVPIVVEQEGAWVEVDGVRYATPAVVPIDNSGRPAQLRVGSPAHSPQLIRLRPVFQWKSLWLGPMGVLVDMVTGSAWQQDDDMLRVDLGRSSFRRAAPPFASSANYRDATRLRSYGKASLVGGAVAGMVGTMLMFSAVCYEECDPGMEMRMASGVLLQGVAVAAIVGGAIAWYKGASRRERVKRRFLVQPTWALSQ